MNDNTSSLYESEAIKSLVLRLDDYSFQEAFSETDSSAIPQREEINSLWLAAMLSVDDYLVGSRSETAETGNAKLWSSWAGQTFEKWQAYVEASSRLGKPEQRDILLLISTGLLGDRQVELRQLLSKAAVEQAMTVSYSASEEWQFWVRSSISSAIFNLARQSSRSDIESALEILKSIRAMQSRNEQPWLSKRENKEQSALSLLSLYHLSSAVEALAGYLQYGLVSTPTGRTSSAENELNVLVGKAEQYADLSSDIELKSWVQAAAIAVSNIRSDTIWANAKNISGNIDKFLGSLSRSGRPLYSMLPSQQEALRKNFLDIQREAVVLQMPTSSGKTLLAELAALQAISSYDDARVVYLTPTRALATQVKRTLGADFREMGVEVVSAGSAFEEDPYELALLKNATGIVVSTPEKMDLILRSHSEWFSKVRLLIVDEAHLLCDGERGARLELLLANFKREQPHVRILLLTPFVENANELAEWLSGERGAPVDVSWRPSRLMLGLATFKGRRGRKIINIEWKEPHRSGSHLSETTMKLTPSEEARLSESSSILNKSTILGGRLKKIGPVLGMFPHSRSAAESAAREFAEDQDEVDLSVSSAEHRVAVALAELEYGTNSSLAFCIRRGSAYHHSALSSELRYLVERLAATGKISFLAATTTLAQGMNFPVSSVVIHSVHKPRRGSLSPAEFWNIAGRAGRVGLSERGLIVFANHAHREHWERYSSYLSERIDSALDDVIGKINSTDSLKWVYRIHEPLRPFLQYLSHASAIYGFRDTLSDLERLVEASFSGRNSTNKAGLLSLAKRYLAEIANKNQGYLKVSDRTGLGSYSFDELYAHIRSDTVLLDGNPEVMRTVGGLKHLVDALVNLPELSLALERGHGSINTELVADVVHRWINGASVVDISSLFPGETEEDRIRAAGTYVFSKVSQTVSWGAHAYLRGRSIAVGEDAAEVSEDAGNMLPAYIQYGVNSPEAVVASILGVPRAVATGIAAAYEELYGSLKASDAGGFRNILERADDGFWDVSVSRSSLKNRVNGSDLRAVWREAQGLN